VIFKKIEVFGFKSFADRLEVDFNGGVTCIVGPNGCGKSNVSDAVRWVLGEQSSKALRGNQMQDVIFKGTEVRGCLGYCEVSLYFDNANGTFPIDYGEVVLTRKLYKSGESEYFINRKTARLKDMNNLLHDSGIDRDGLTIISQGQVAEIISSKPEARRSIFEEAAGISKFKARKQEAEKRLERTALDLARVSDVINEIERTLVPLLKQAEAAEKYLLLREELKILEINAYIAQYDSAANEKSRLQAELDEIDAAVKTKQHDLVCAGGQISSAMKEISALESKSEYLREQVLNLSVDVEREQNQRKLAQIEKLNELKLEHARLLTKKHTLENLVESGEGYKYSVRKILEEKYKNSAVSRNIIGVVSQSLKVPGKYETAVEIALGASAQNIITHDEQGAQEIIDRLKRENWGRATFLPLTAARAKTLSDQERGMIEQYGFVLGVASGLVRYDKIIEPVVLALLGRTVVVDRLENATELARRTKYAFKIVTLDGDLIETRGSITGGSKNMLNNNLWHNNNLAIIENSLTDLQERIDNLSRETQSDESLLYERKRLENVIKLDTSKAELDGFIGQKEELRALIDIQEQNKMMLSDEISNLTRSYYRTENALARVDINIEQMQTRIEEEYGMNYSGCYVFKQDNFDLVCALTEINNLKRQIQSLGPVNLGAIEASRESKARFDEYSAQVADLTAAKADIEKIICELSAEMESKFKSDFEKINHNFGVVFKELFGGGHARLELVEADGKKDWLNGGIDIIAEPPGKKLSNITLLSGGEKALTAIAILFAILKLRPMPFCLLDEIEAALDEANVARFANYLQKFSRTTQFIVITHRKATMELADNLYGVTMEEKGVSKIVSVKLEKWYKDQIDIELPETVRA
jgi:chromosome segregation protein